MSSESVVAYAHDAAGAVDVDGEERRAWDESQADGPRNFGYVDDLDLLTSRNSQPAWNTGLARTAQFLPRCSASEDARALCVVALHQRRESERLASSSALSVGGRRTQDDIRFGIHAPASHDC